MSEETAVDTPAAGGPESNEAATPEAATDPGLRDRVVAALKTVRDPEIPVNIYDLGLVYGLEIDPEGRVSIRMTLTAPGCPVAGILPLQVEQAVRAVEGVNDVHVELVWDPPWTQDRISDEAKLELGLF
ncbi:MAG: SUF system Fe-S cluster assembly protein [Gammaproteobacteria bacterium]|nr:MAG: SUF system Fe-S cluster assembly protein [Gammaproteobacteria bacterium]